MATCLAVCTSRMHILQRLLRQARIGGMLLAWCRHACCAFLRTTALTQEPTPTRTCVPPTLSSFPVCHRLVRRPRTPWRTQPSVASPKVAGALGRPVMGKVARTRGPCPQKIAAVACVAPGCLYRSACGRGERVHAGTVAAHCTLHVFMLPI